MFKEMKKKNLSKVLKESMRVMSHKIQNSNKETEIIKCRKELG